LPTRIRELPEPGDRAGVLISFYCYGSESHKDLPTNFRP
jgi:hypothetical protein